jgi:predicted nucleic acid-binding Zn ribbon protein
MLLAPSPRCRSQSQQQEAPQLTAVSALLAAAAAAQQATGQESDADQPQQEEEGGEQGGVAVVQLPRSLVTAGLDELQQSQEQLLQILQEQVGEGILRCFCYPTCGDCK